MKPVISSFNVIAPLIIQQYERYLPTAFDESMSLVQKVNKVIEYLNQMGLLVNDVVLQWNEVMEWVMNNGLDEAVKNRLDEMVADGTLGQLINIGVPKTPFDYGAKGDGVTDDTQAIKSLLLAHKNVHFPVADYVITESIIFDQHKVTAQNNARILKSFQGNGVYCVGGSSYTTITNLTVEGWGNGRATNGEASQAHGIVVIGNRVDFVNVRSLYNQGNGFEFISESTVDSGYVGVVPTYIGNMNRCNLEKVYSQYNDGIGFHFKGLKDDMSVWKINIFSTYNRKNGIKVEIDSQFRVVEGSIYSENDGLANTATDHSVYLGRIRYANLTIYAEGKNNLNASEIFVDNACMSTTVYSMRSNRDVILANDLVFPSYIRRLGGEYKTILYGNSDTNSEYQITPIKEFDHSPLSNKLNRYSDVLYTENTDTKTFKRVRGYGTSTDYIVNEGFKLSKKTDDLLTGKNTTIYGSHNRNQILTAKGTYDVPASAVVGDVVHTEEVKTYFNGGFKNLGKIQYEVVETTVDRIGCDIVFYAKPTGSLSTYEESFRITNGGLIKIAKLAGVGDRPLLVDSNGILKV